MTDQLWRIRDIPPRKRAVRRAESLVLMSSHGTLRDGGPEDGDPEWRAPPLPSTFDRSYAKETHPLQQTYQQHTASGCDETRDTCFDAVIEVYIRWDAFGDLADIRTGPSIAHSTRRQRAAKSFSVSRYSPLRIRVCGCLSNLLDLGKGWRPQSGSPSQQSIRSAWSNFILHLPDR